MHAFSTAFRVDIAWSKGQHNIAMSDDDYYEDDFEEDVATPPGTPPVAPVAAASGVMPIGVGYDDASPGYGSPTGSHVPWSVITLDELELGDKLAAGAMGAITGGFYRGRPVAVKTLHDTSSKALASVEAELLVHASLKHERVVELIGANLVPGRGCCIVMERCECSLFERLHRRPDEMSRRELMRLAIQVAEGMQHLHTRRPPVVHRDLKSHNVLLDGSGGAKLCDFGLVNTREVTAGTPNYMAPELFLQKPNSASVDVFAFGVLLNEMWAREVPWDGYLPLDIKDKVVAGERPPSPRSMPLQCESLLSRLWHKAASLRPSFAEALPLLEAVLDNLPAGVPTSRGYGCGGGGGMPMDSLDALDSMMTAGLSLKARR